MLSQDVTNIADVLHTRRPDISWYVTFSYPNLFVLRHFVPQESLTLTPTLTLTPALTPNSHTNT